MSGDDVDKAAILKAMDGFGKTRVLVVGDLMLDRFIWGKVSRISPEAPVPVVLVGRESVMLGGAANVASNLAALGAGCVLLGTLGDDGAAGEFRREMDAKGIGGDCIVVDPARPTIEKIRVVAHSQQVVRVDREISGGPAADVEKALAAKVKAAGDGFGAVLVSDYAKGVISPGVMDAVAAMSIERGIPLIVDPKKKDLSLYTGATYITPNLKEASESTGVDIMDADSLELAGRRILEQVSCKGVLVTRGEDGMTLFTREGTRFHVPSVAREVYDVTGAGDTVISTFSLALAAGLGEREAVYLANVAAGRVVEKVGTAVVTTRELRELLEEGA